LEGTSVDHLVQPQIKTKTTQSFRKPYTNTNKGKPGSSKNSRQNNKQCSTNARRKPTETTCTWKSRKNWITFQEYASAIMQCSVL